MMDQKQEILEHDRIGLIGHIVTVAALGILGVLTFGLGVYKLTFP